jgi:chromosome partitioning protein
LAFDRQSKGAIAYLALAGEILRRNEPNISPAVEAAASN